jgi:hypothetical protein
MARIEIVDGPLETPCWQWTGAKCSGRYGHLTFKGKQLLVHRVMWTIYNGEIQNGLWVLHKCHVKQCCNIDHLMIGTPSENQRQAGKRREGRNTNTKRETEEPKHDQQTIP